MRADRLKFRVWSPSAKDMFTDIENFTINGDGDLFYFGQKAASQMVLMQSTGLRDKNGVIIFEGDILRMFGNRVKEVRWNNTFGLWDMQSHDSVYDVETSFCSEVDAEVIGNIHENPELLNDDIMIGFSKDLPSPSCPICKQEYRVKNLPGAHVELCACNSMSIAIYDTEEYWKHVANQSNEYKYNPLNEGQIASFTIPLIYKVSDLICSHCKEAEVQLTNPSWPFDDPYWLCDNCGSTYLYDDYKQS